jgi:hypothetical protein
MMKKRRSSVNMAGLEKRYGDIRGASQCEECDQGTPLGMVASQLEY